MFAKPRRLAWGAAALGPIVSIGLPATAHAATTPAAPPAPKNYCVVNAVSAAQIKAGVQSVMVCFATKAEYEAAISGTGGPVTSAFGSGFIMANFYDSRSMDGRVMTMKGSSCSDSLYSTPDAWQEFMQAWAPQGCSSAKHFTGANFTGTSVFTSNSSYAFSPPLLRNIHSIKFG